MKPKFVKQARLPAGAYTYDFKEVMGEAKAIAMKRKWCVKHPRSFWGEGYIQCVEGRRKGEECEKGK